MSTKKRKIEDEEEDEDELLPSLPRKRPPGAKYSAHPKKVNDRFLQEKKKLYYHAVSQIMGQYEQALTTDKLPASTGPHPNFVRDAVLECRARLAEARDLYDPPQGDVIAMGQEDCGQLGLVNFIGKENVGYGPTLNLDLRENIVRVVCGAMHSACITNDGMPYTWGCSDDGQLGRPFPPKTEDPEEIAATVPTEVKGFYPSQNHSKVSPQVTSKPCEDGEIIAIDAGVSHTLFLTINGNVYSTGMYKDNDSGKFCDPRPPDDPTKITNEEEAAPDSVKGNRWSPVHVYRLTQPVKQIAAGGSFNAALYGDGSIVTWGMGHMGELARSKNMVGGPNTSEGGYDLTRSKIYVNNEGEFDLEKVSKLFLTPAPPCWELGVGKKIVKHVACGVVHLMVSAHSPGQDFCQAYTSGLNNYGQLGHGDTTNRHELTLVQELKDVHLYKCAGGNFHSLWLATDGQVYSCGRGDYGQLGIETDKDGEKGKAGDFVSSPQKVPLPIVDNPMEVGRIVDVSAGESHSLAITSTGKVYSWGYGEYGAPGNDPNTSVQDIRRPRLGEKWIPGTEIVATGISGGAQHTLIVAKRYKAS